MKADQSAFSRCNNSPVAELLQSGNQAAFRWHKGLKQVCLTKAEDRDQAGTTLEGQTGKTLAAPQDLLFITHMSEHKRLDLNRLIDTTQTRRQSNDSHLGFSASRYTSS